MAFGPDTNNDLSLKGSLMRQWPGEKVSPPSPARDAAAEPEVAGDPNAAIFRLGDKGGDLLRLNMARLVSDGTLDPEKVGVLLGPLADSVRIASEKRKEEQRKQDANLRFMRALQEVHDRLREIEDKLAAKYGHNFAEDLARRYLKKEEADQILGIKDEEERRHRIALTIKEKINRGEITPKDIDNDPRLKELREWFETHEEKAKILKAEAEQAIEDVKAGKDIEISERKSLEAMHLADKNELKKIFSSSAAISLDDSNPNDKELDNLFASQDAFLPKSGGNSFS